MTLKSWMDAFGDNLSDILEERGMTQQELARASGVSVGSINAYIHKQSPPGIKAIVNISYVLDIDFNDLLDFGDMID